MNNIEIRKKECVLGFNYNDMDNFDRKRLKEIERELTKMGISFDTHFSKDKCTRYWILKDNDKLSIEE